MERVLGANTLWRPFIPQRTVINEAVGMRCPVQDLGYRARDVIATFDTLYQRVTDVLPPPPDRYRSSSNVS